MHSGSEQQETEKNKQMANFKKKDRKCIVQVIQRIADLEYAKDKEPAYDLWKTLENTFEMKGIANQLLVRKSLLTMKFNAKCNKLANHFLEFDKLIRNFTYYALRIQ